MLQPDPVDHGHAGKDAVEIVGIALRHGQRLAAALGRSHEIHFFGLLAVGAHHQRHGGIAHLLVGNVREILERLVVERKQLRRLAGLALMAGIGAVGDKAARQRRRLVERIGRRQPEPGDQHAIKAAAAILQRAAVPFDRQVDLELDRRRLGIGRRDRAQHLAERGVGRRDAPGRRRSALGDRKRRGCLQRRGIDGDGAGRSGKSAADGGGVVGQCRRGCGTCGCKSRQHSSKQRNADRSEIAASFPPGFLLSISGALMRRNRYRETRSALSPLPVLHGERVGVRGSPARKC